MPFDPNALQTAADLQADAVTFGEFINNPAGNTINRNDDTFPVLQQRVADTFDPLENGVVVASEADFITDLNFDNFTVRGATTEGTLSVKLGASGQGSWLTFGVVVPPSGVIADYRQGKLSPGIPGYQFVGATTGLTRDTSTGRYTLTAGSTITIRTDMEEAFLSLPTTFSVFFNVASGDTPTVQYQQAEADNSGVAPLADMPTEGASFVVRNETRDANGTQVVVAITAGTTDLTFDQLPAVCVGEPANAPTDADFLATLLYRIDSAKPDENLIDLVTPVPNGGGTSRNADGSFNITADTNADIFIPLPTGLSSGLDLACAFKFVDANGDDFFPTDVSVSRSLVRNAGDINGSAGPFVSTGGQIEGNLFGARGNYATQNGTDAPLGYEFRVQASESCRLVLVGLSRGLSWPAVAFKQQVGTTKIVPEITASNIDAVKAHIGGLVRCNGAGAQTVTFGTEESEGWEVGDTTTYRKDGSGNVTLAGATGVTLQAPGGRLIISEQFNWATAIYQGGDVWMINGGLSA